MIDNVLPFRSPSPQASFRLREVARNGVGEISAWFAENRGARAAFRIRVQHLQKINRLELHTAQFRVLNFNLAEIKWKSGKKQFRAIGFDFRDSFVLVLGCTHKMNVYVPPQCLSTAKRVKEEVENGVRNTIEFKP